MLRWKKKQWFEKERGKMKQLTTSQKRHALMTLGDPESDVYKFLVALMDEMMRNGIYLDETKRLQAQFFVETLTEQMVHGTKLLERHMEGKNPEPEDE